MRTSLSASRAGMSMMEAGWERGEQHANLTTSPDNGEYTSTCYARARFTRTSLA